VVTIDEDLPLTQIVEKMKTQQIVYLILDVHNAANMTRIKPLWQNPDMAHEWD